MLAVGERVPDPRVTAVSRDPNVEPEAAGRGVAEVGGKCRNDRRALPRCRRSGRERRTADRERQPDGEQRGRDASHGHSVLRNGTVVNGGLTQTSRRVIQPCHNHRGWRVWPSSTTE